MRSPQTCPHTTRRQACFEFPLVSVMQSDMSPHTTTTCIHTHIYTLLSKARMKRKKKKKISKNVQISTNFLKDS